MQFKILITILFLAVFSNIFSLTSEEAWKIYSQKLSDGAPYSEVMNAYDNYQKLIEAKSNDESSKYLKYKDHVQKVLGVKLSPLPDSEIRDFGQNLIHTAGSIIFGIKNIFSINSVDDFISEGNRNFAIGNFDKAYQLYCEGMNKSNENDEIKIRLLHCLIEMKDYQKADDLLSSFSIAPPWAVKTDFSENNLHDTKPWEIPVLIICYLPTTDGKIIDQNETGMIINPNLTIDQARDRISRIFKGIKSSLEEGSKYNGYKNKESIPNLKYIVVDRIEHLTPLPKTDCPYAEDTWDNWSARPYIVDYNNLITSNNVKEYIENKGVKEIWLWGYHSDTLTIWESNMSSPYGDVSNSRCSDEWGKNDLPVYSDTYTVFTYNLDRDVSEGVENHTHQLEALLRNRNYELFWNRFVGYFPAEDRNILLNENKLSEKRRCGWAHFPPNGNKDYDWNNSQNVFSDMNDWNPDGTGELSEISSNIWEGNSLKWFIYWRQHIPGKDNNLEFEGRKLLNWWFVIANWDEVMKNNMDLLK